MTACTVIRTAIKQPPGIIGFILLNFLQGLFLLGLSAWYMPAEAGAGPLQYVQYGRVSWKFDDGTLPDEPQVMVQTRDGYIWMGSPSGLYRFDGVRFDKYESPSADATGLADIQSLHVDAAGRLLVGTCCGVFAVKGKEVAKLTANIGRINAIFEDRGGTIWLARSRPNTSGGGVCRLDVDKVECLGSSSQCPYAGSLVQDTNGTIWSGASDELCKVTDAGLIPVPIPALKTQRGLSGVSSLLANPDGSITVGYYHPGPSLGLQRYKNGIFEPERIPGIDGEQFAFSSQERDSSGGLWLGTVETGLIHVHDGLADRIPTEAGLSGSGVISSFQDAEGDVWVVTSGGIDRFRRRLISSFGRHDGLPSDEFGAVLAMRNGDVVADGPNGLGVISKNSITAIYEGSGLPGKAVTSMQEDHLGNVWMQVDNQVYTWRDNHFTLIATEDGKPLRPIIRMFEANDGAMWMLMSGTPKPRILRAEASGTVKEISVPPASKPRAIASDPSGNIWASFSDGKIARFTGQDWETISENKDVASASRFVFLTDSSVVFLTKKGLLIFNQGRWRDVATADGLPCDHALGAIHDHANQLWVHLSCGYTNISDQALADLLAGKSDALHLPLYDRTQGAVTEGSTFGPDSGVSTDGRVWFATDEMLQMIDPSALTTNIFPPPVHVEGLVVDGHKFPTLTKTMLPALSKDIEISYAALSFPDPRKVQFRYKLRGPAGSPWTDAGTRRIAIFSRLLPGQYDFQVIASNNDGVWNSVGDHLTFVIPPTFYQTIWFEVLVSLIALLALWTLVSLRIGMARKKMEMRIGERLLERDRIARELHDTLLQGVQSIALRFQIVADAMPNNEPAKELALSSLTKADSVMQEIREKVKDLRQQETDSHSLADSICVAYEELKQAELPVLRVNIVGAPRVLRSGITSELISIAREVIFNSILHGNATEIACDLRFGARFSIVMQDDGCGLPPDVLAKGGRAGHWGLIGIRERAKKMGGSVRIESSQMKGTKIVVSLDSRLAYNDSSGLVLERIKALYRRGKRLANPKRFLHWWMHRGLPVGGSALAGDKQSPS